MHVNDANASRQIVIFGKQAYKYTHIRNGNSTQLFFGFRNFQN